MTETDASSQKGNSSRGSASEKTSGLKLLLICHGEGMQHRYADLGSVNSGLTANGWGQVESLSNWLSTHESVDALYSGPLLQCRLTAQRVGQSVNRPVAMLADFTTHNASASDREVDNNATSADGNGLISFCPAIDDILHQTGAGVVVLVASALNIRAILRTILDANDTIVELDHTGITAVHINDDNWSVAYINRREHMPSPVVVAAPERESVAEEPEEQQDLGSVITVYNRVAVEDVAHKATDDRERIESLLKFAKLPESLDVLDAGTGLGVLAMMIAEVGADSVIGVDISPGMLEQAEYLRLSHPTNTTGRISYRLARLQRLPFPDERFDAVVCRLVLNHFKSLNQVIKEIVRVLKPNGVFVMAELLSVDDPVKRATQNAIEERRNPSHVAARSAEQYDNLISNAGLEIIDTATVGIEREMSEWLEAYHTSIADSETVMDMVEAGLETDAAGIGAKRRGDRIEFIQRMYYLKAIKPDAA